jgi:hypothetical protein
MNRFLREHWLYFVVPLLVVLLVIAVLVLTDGGPGGEHVYPQ